MQEFDLPTAQVYTPEIRFVDIDAAGIVNNATYFNYFEQSRLLFSSRFSAKNGIGTPQGWW